MTVRGGTPPPPGHDDDALEVTRPSPRGLLAALVVVLLLLVVLDVAASANGSEAAERFSLDGEITLAAWWASVQLLLLGILFGLVAMSEARRGRRRTAWTLSVGAAVAVFLSVNETAAFHEAASVAFAARDVFPEIAIGSGLWVFAYGVVAAAIFVITLPGIVSLYSSHRTETFWVALGGAILVFGGVAIEIFTHSIDSHVEIVLEEFFELLGIAIMVWATYVMLGDQQIRVSAN